VSIQFHPISSAVPPFSFSGSFFKTPCLEGNCSFFFPSGRFSLFDLVAFFASAVPLFSLPLLAEPDFVSFEERVPKPFFPLSRKSFWAPFVCLDFTFARGGGGFSFSLAFSSHSCGPFSDGNRRADSDRFLGTDLLNVLPLAFFLELLRFPSSPFRFINAHLVFGLEGRIPPRDGMPFPLPFLPRKLSFPACDFAYGLLMSVPILFLPLFSSPRSRSQLPPVLPFSSQTAQGTFSSRWRQF